MRKAAWNTHCLLLSDLDWLIAEQNCGSKAHQFASPEPACGVGPNADGVFSRVVGGECEPSLGSIVP